MQNVELKTLTLSYFKGQKNTSISFNHITNIKGANATGKSTVLDAWIWLLFGKNAQGQSDTSFSIKTLDANNNVIPMVEHTVEGLVVINGEEVLLKRTLREKWSKIRGSEETVFKGNETIYFFNDVPKSKKEYDEKISNILNEEIFKVCSDPLAFNSLHWQKMRDILMAIVGGEVSNESVAEGNEKFQSLISKLSNKDLEEYKKELSAKRVKLMKEISFIPSRIDEQTKSKPEEVDYTETEAQIADLNTKLSEVDVLISDKNKVTEKAAKERQDIANKIFDLKSGNQNIEFKIKSEINNQVSETVDPVGLKETELRNKSNSHESIVNGLKGIKETSSTLKTGLEKTEESILKIREEWTKENAKELKFDEEGFNCPTCKRELEADDIDSQKEKLTKDFNASKKEKLSQLSLEGKNLSSEIGTKKTEILALSKRIENGEIEVTKSKKEVEVLNSELEALKLNPSKSVDKPKLIEEAKLASETYQSNIKEIEKLEATEIKDIEVNITDLKIQKEDLTKNIKELEAVLNTKDQILKIENRIAELKAEESNLAKEIALIEREQFIVNEFVTAKIDSLEVKINNLFTGDVSVKMFKEQTDGIIPWCTVLVNGVPFADANTAGKTNAGLSIINVLNKYYEITTPVFIDNRESTTNLIDTEAQVINLIVSPENKKLQIT